MGGHTTAGARWRSLPASLANRFRLVDNDINNVPRDLCLMDYFHIKFEYEGWCRGQGGEFILPPDTAAVEAEEEEECPDTCGFNYAPVCGTGKRTGVNI